MLAEDAALPPGLNAELAAILDLLDPARPGRVPFPILIEGAAATGKTALAMSAMSAAQARGWFPGGFLLASLRAQGRDIRRDIREVVTRLLQALQVPPEHLPVATTDRIELYQGVLAAYAADNRRVLVFFDEAPDSVQMRLLLPADDKTEIIVTSRSHLDIEPAHVVRLERRDEPVFVPAPDLPPGPRLALVIATTEYQDPVFRELPGALRDAHEFASVLADPAIGGFEVTQLFNQTGSRILREITSFLTSRRSDETVVIYLACHAIQDERGRLFFAASDTQPGHLFATAISVSVLDDELSRCAARQQVLILDCRFSGLTDDAMVAREINTGKLLDHGRGREVLTASYGWSSPLMVPRPAPGPRTSRISLAGWWGPCAPARAMPTETATSPCKTPSGTPPCTYGPRAGSPPRRTGFGLESGPIVLARSPAGRAVVPATLPVPVTETLRSPYPNVRIAAVDEIAQWLTDPDLARALAARRALEQVVDTDIPRVTEVAAAHLRRAGEPAASAPPRRPRQCGWAGAPNREVRLPRAFHTGPGSGLVRRVSPDGRLLASGGRRHPGARP